MSDSSPRWIRTDIARDLLNSLEHCLLTVTLARSDERNWKWAVAAAHSAAQASMVLVLKHQQRDQHLTLKSRKKLIAYYEKSRAGPAEYPTLRLADFMDLYKECRDLLPKGVADDNHRTELELLNARRNHWTHFGEFDGSSMRIDNARRAALAGIKLVTELMPHTPEHLYESQAEVARYEVAIAALKRLLSLPENHFRDGSAEEDEKWADLLSQYGCDEEGDE